MLIGSEVGDGNATKNFTIASIIGLANLGGFVPYTGATGNVDLGLYSLTADSATISDGLTVLSGLAEFNGPIQAIGSLTLDSQLIDGLGNPGTSGQLLSTNGSEIIWTTYGLQEVLDAGDTANNVAIVLSGTSSITAPTIESSDALIVGGTLEDVNSSVGTAGQLLSSTVIGTEWKTYGLQEVLDAGNTATEDINLTGTIDANTVTAGQVLNVEGELKDSTGSNGSANQLLSSNGTLTQWKTYGLQEVLNAGDTAIGSITLSGVTSGITSPAVEASSALIVGGTLEDYDSSVGTSGQILSSTGIGTKWINSAAVIDSYKGSFFDNLNQALTGGANVAVPIILRQVDAAATNGVSVVTDGTNLTRITVANAGVYNISFSAQLSNGTGSSHVADFWLRKNGETAAFNVPNSNRNIHAQSNTSDIMAAWNYFIALNANDYVYLMWTANSLAVSINPDSSTAVKPFGPSVVLTINKI
jgi:hypothetical protein